MPLVIYSQPVERVSGRSEGQPVVYTYNRGQSVLRVFTNPSQPDTSDQIEIRAIFSALTKNWKELSSAQRNAWNTWAAEHPVRNRLGNRVSRTGLTAYVQLGTMYYIRTGSLPTAAPVLAQPASPTGITDLLNDSNEPSFEVTHTYTTLTGLYLVARMTSAIPSAAITPRISAYRMISGVSNVSIQALAASGTAYVWSDPKYVPTVGARFGIEVSIMNAEGWESNPYRTTLTAAAP